MHATRKILPQPVDLERLAETVLKARGWLIRELRNGTCDRYTRATIRTVVKSLNPRTNPRIRNIRFRRKPDLSNLQIQKTRSRRPQETPA